MQIRKITDESTKLVCEFSSKCVFIFEKKHLLIFIINSNCSFMKLEVRYLFKTASGGRNGVAKMKILIP